MVDLWTKIVIKYDITKNKPIIETKRDSVIIVPDKLEKYNVEEIMKSIEKY